MQNNEQKTKFTNKLEVISCSHFIIQEKQCLDFVIWRIKSCLKVKAELS